MIGGVECAWPHLISGEHKAVVTTLIPELDAEGDGSDPLIRLGSVITVQPVHVERERVCVCVCVRERERE